MEAPAGPRQCTGQTRASIEGARLEVGRGHWPGVGGGKRHRPGRWPGIGGGGVGHGHQPGHRLRLVVAGWAAGADRGSEGGDVRGSDRR
jgi:hypothetical protein